MVCRNTNLNRALENNNNNKNNEANDQNTKYVVIESQSDQIKSTKFEQRNLVDSETET